MITYIARLLLYFSLATTAIVGAGCVTDIERPTRKVDKEKLVDANIKLGMAYLQQNQRESGLRAFTKALDVDKKSAEGHLGMALIHQMNGELKAAEDAFERAFKYREDSSEAAVAYSYGRYLMESDRCKKAFEMFELASQDLTYSRRADALFNLGVCADKMGNEPRARAAYQHALNLKKRYAPAALELAHKDFERGDYAQAKKYLDVYSLNARQSARSLWLGIQIERIFGNKDKEASYALALRNLHPYSREYLMYKELKDALTDDAELKKHANEN